MSYVTKAQVNKDGKLIAIGKPIHFGPDEDDVRDALIEAEAIEKAKGGTTVAAAPAAAKSSKPSKPSKPSPATADAPAAPADPAAGTGATLAPAAA